MKKLNCINCSELEYIEAEDWDNNGYVCNARHYRNSYEENKHLVQLEKREYREKSKVCCVPRNEAEVLN